MLRRLLYYPIQPQPHLPLVGAALAAVVVTQITLLVGDLALDIWLFAFVPGTYTLLSLLVLRAERRLRLEEAYEAVNEVSALAARTEEHLAVMSQSEVHSSLLDSVLADHSILDARIEAHLERQADRPLDDRSAELSLYVGFLQTRMREHGRRLRALASVSESPQIELDIRDDRQVEASREAAPPSELRSTRRT